MNAVSGLASTTIDGPMGCQPRPRTSFLSLLVTVIGNRRSPDAAAKMGEGGRVPSTQVHAMTACIIASGRPDPAEMLPATLQILQYNRFSHISTGGPCQFDPTI